MKHTNFRRGLAGLLAALTLVQGCALTALAAEVETPQVTEQAVTQAKPQLQNGTAVIPADATPEQVKELLCEALVVNADQVDAQSLEWEYYCEGKSDSGMIKNSEWGSIAGFTTTKYVLFVGNVTLYHPALKDNSDVSYQVRLKGTTDEVTLTKAAKLSSSIVLNEVCEVALPYNKDAAVDYDALRAAIFKDVVASTTPELSVGDVTIEYYATATTGSVGDAGKAWMPLEGGTSWGLTYPGMTVGENQEIRISYAENDTYYGSSAETTVTITERPEAPYTLKETPDAVTLAVGEDMKVDYNALEDAIFHAVVASSEVLTADNVTVTYYYEGITELDSKWLPLEGQAVVGGLGYPAISAGEQKVRISWPGNQTYAPATIEATITVKDREQVQFTLNEGPYEVSMVFDDEQGYDYTATAKAIYNAVVASTTPVSFSAEDVTVEYNADPTSIFPVFKPLDYTDLGGLVKFGVGEWKIRISVADTQAYLGNHVDVTVTTTDNRAASAVVLKEGASFTYNMDANVMEQAILDNVIDWDASTLPAKDTLTADDFVIEYYGKAVLFDGGIDSDIEGWAPIEGKSYDTGTINWGAYPQMGAGENQQIRISFKGDANYKPCDEVEGTVTVNKAKVSVKVNSTNIYTKENLPADFITTDPADEFDIYTIYAGVTSNVTTALYLDLPERYTDSGFLKLIDEALKLAGQKTLTQMMQEGVTVGELRELLSTQALLDLLDKLNIDTGTFGKILETINNLPGIADSVRVAFGEPTNRAGLYTVAAVTDNQNYETGVGIGFLLVKMHLSGSQLTWNKEIPNGKLTAEQAKTFDFKATLSYNGDVNVDQSSVHYLYSGFTSKWRVYSSTTTPPSEPGRYVVTVCILGGNYMAAPITRSFQITK